MLRTPSITLLKTERIEIGLKLLKLFLVPPFYNKTVLAFKKQDGISL